MRHGHCSPDGMNVSVVGLHGALAVLSLLGTLARCSVAMGEDTPTVRLPADVTYGAAEGSPGPVTFSHETHVPLARRLCPACHPALFSILGPTGRITHEEMDAGRKCGACHDGKSAQDACDHCHRGGDDP
jgi:c(7)-type cytochrome triheme protein